MAELSTNVRYIKGIGETRAKALEKLGITTLRDLIGYFPRTYEDRRGEELPEHLSLINRKQPRPDEHLAGHNDAQARPAVRQLAP